ncbi:MAG: hypothetical protein ACQEW8_01110 [Actinomycetota bacterium]
MTETVPHAWVPIPFGVAADDADDIVETVLSTVTTDYPGVTIDDTVRDLARRAITRAPVHDGVSARLWHALGTGATGVIADLAVGPPTTDLDARFSAGFAHAQLQRRIPLDGGVATISFVAPDSESAPAVLLRAQRLEAGSLLTVDVLDADLRLVGLVVDDVLRMVGAEPAEAGPDI